MGQMCVPAVLIEIKTGSRLACGNKVANTTRRFRVLPPDKQVSQHFIETRLNRSRTFGTFARLLDGLPTSSIRLPGVPLVTRSDREAEAGPAIGALLAGRSKHKLGRPLPFDATTGQNCAMRRLPELLGPVSPSQ